jgi:hypothetical protein
MSVEKNVKDNPWLVEAEKYTEDKKPREDIHDMKFQDDKEYNVRLLPSPNPKEFPYYGYTQHWLPQLNSKKNRPITHPIDQTCAVCDWISEQWKEINRLKEEDDMTDKSPEVQAIYNKKKPVNGKQRYDFNVIDRADPFIEKDSVKEVLVKRMPSPFGVYEEIFRSAKKNGSPSDEDEGYDFCITTSGEGERRQYSCQPSRDDSPLTDLEKKALKKCYDLPKLRKSSTTEEIMQILQNAKPPYNEILEFITESSSKAILEKKAVAEEKKVVVEEKKAIVEEKKVTPQPPIEPVSSTFAQEEQKPKVDLPVNALNFDQDTSELNEYGCKGTVDEGDIGCNNPDDPCPAKEACIAFKPIFEAAKNFGIDVTEERKADDILADVKAKMQIQPVLKEEEPQQSSRRRRRSSEEESAPVATPVIAEGSERRTKKQLPF